MYGTPPKICHTLKICDDDALYQGAMSGDQIRDCEQTVLDIIAADYTVYAKETPLSLAKEVQGLRAIFDEVEYANLATLSLCV